MYIDTTIVCSQQWLAYYKRHEYYIPMSVIVALQFDRHVETARFQSVKHKAQITLFLYIGPHSSSDPPTGRASVWEQLQKYKKFLKYTKKAASFFKYR